MKESKTTKQLAENMAEAAKSMFKTFSSRSGSLLHFNENYISSLYAERFNINDKREQFEKAFQIVTNGVGNEAAKINSIISSSLLSLLIFHKLFENESEETHIKLNLNGHEYTFSQALFEMRNTVVGYPSCIDVVLIGTDGTLLFLESKFTEYIDEVSTSKSYGIGYCPLYKRFEDCLKDTGLSVETNEKNLILTSNSGKRYIEGVKQSVSHLIGLVKGPQKVIDGPYNETYLNNYISLYEKAPKLIYGTILFDPRHILPEAGKAFDDYKDLYECTIGNNGERIVSEIEAQFTSDYNPVIEVLPSLITYQQMLNDNESYKLELPDRVLNLYQL